MKYILFLMIGLVILGSCSNEKGGMPKEQQSGLLDKPNTLNMEMNNWTIGCEVLDRDFANYHIYKQYLDSLGCKTGRLQAGWAKTEQKKGVYDFQWLDEIVDDMLSRKIRPWLQLSYGNPIYVGGGDRSLGGGFPTSKEALQAWDNWVRATVTRYKDKIDYWEVWNEGNLNTNNDPSVYADLYIRTSEIIRQIQPQSQISALALSQHGIEFADQFFEYLDSVNKIHLVDEVTYHPYEITPEKSYTGANELKEIIAKYSSSIILKQGENGAPSTSKTSGALSGYNWNEHRQAKWVLRRMLSDLGHDMPSQVFTIIDFNYPAGEFTTGWNTKGLLKADRSNGSVEYKKKSFVAVQNLTSIFDNQIERLDKVDYSIDMSKVKSESQYLLQEDNFFSLYGYNDNESETSFVVLWLGGEQADIDTDTLTVDLMISDLKIKNPVSIDLLSGSYQTISLNDFSVNEQSVEIKNLTITDWPRIIADIKLVK